jgi:hypothetical protein
MLFCKKYIHYVLEPSCIYAKNVGLSVLAVASHASISEAKWILCVFFILVKCVVSLWRVGKSQRLRFQRGLHNLFWQDSGVSLQAALVLPKIWTDYIVDYCHVLNWIGSKVGCISNR